MKVLKNYGLFSRREKAILASVVLAFLLAGCGAAYDGDIRSGNREITLDIDNALFRVPDAAAQYDRGPGVTRVVFTFSFKEENAGDVQAVLTAADSSGTVGYTQIKQAVSGTLSSVKAEASMPDGSVFSAILEDKPESESFFGWQIFANVMRFKLEFLGNPADDWSGSTLSLDISPRGGTGIRFLTDAGVTAPADMQTDWGGAALAGAQIAIEPLLSENPAGLEFDVYILIVDEDLRSMYKPELNTDAGYEVYPWAEVWEVSEVTETGRRIADKVYKMEKWNSGGALPFIEPVGSGYDSFVIDLSSVDGAVGKYLMFSLLVKYDVLSVVSQTGIVEIE